MISPGKTGCLLSSLSNFDGCSACGGAAWGQDLQLLYPLYFCILHAYREGEWVINHPVFTVLSVLPSSLFSQFSHPHCPLCSPVLSVFLSSQFFCPLFFRPLCSPVLLVLLSSEFSHPLSSPVLFVHSSLGSQSSPAPSVLSQFSSSTI